MNIRLKERLQQKKNNLKDIKYKIDLEQEKLEVHQKYIDEMQSKNKERIDNLKAEIKKSETAISRLEDDISKNNSSVKDLQESVKDEESVQKKLNEILKIESKFEEKLKIITLAYTQLKNTYRGKFDSKY